MSDLLPTSGTNGQGQMGIPQSVGDWLSETAGIFWLLLGEISRKEAALVVNIYVIGLNPRSLQLKVTCGLH